MTQPRTMTQARTQALMLAAVVVLAVSTAGERLRGRLRSPERERGALALEWAIIAAIAVVIAGIVAVKVVAAVNAHAAQIK